VNHSRIDHSVYHPSGGVY